MKITKEDLKKATRESLGENENDLYKRYKILTIGQYKFLHYVPTADTHFVPPVAVAPIQINPDWIFPHDKEE